MRTKNTPVVERLRAAGDEEAAETIERLERAVKAMYLQYRIAYRTAEDALDREIAALGKRPVKAGGEH